MGWRVTLTSLWCEKVGEWVAIMVYKDGDVRCSYLLRHELSKGKRKGRQILHCNPSICNLCTSYKEKVLSR